METKMIIVPFDVDMAKKITNGEVEGRIIDNDGNHYRLVCFDLADDKGKIIGLRKNNNYTETALTFNDNGYCVQHPSRNLMLEIPEYMTFNDGDVLYCKGLLDWVFIYKKECHKTSYYAAVDLYMSSLYFDGHTSADNNILELRFATEYEKQKLIEALKASKEPKAKECLRMLGIEVKPECEFKPFDKVLVKDDDENSAWSCNLFSGKNEDGTYMCIGGYWDMCIPYNDQTKHLLGTTDNWEE